MHGDPQAATRGPAGPSLPARETGRGGQVRPGGASARPIGAARGGAGRRRPEPAGQLRAGRPRVLGGFPAGGSGGGADRPDPPRARGAAGRRLRGEGGGSPGRVRGPTGGGAGEGAARPGRAMEAPAEDTPQRSGAGAEQPRDGPSRAALSWGAGSTPPGAGSGARSAGGAGGCSFRRVAIRRRAQASYLPGGTPRPWSRPPSPLGRARAAADAPGKCLGRAGAQGRGVSPERRARPSPPSLFRPCPRGASAGARLGPGLPWRSFKRELRK